MAGVLKTTFDCVDAFDKLPYNGYGGVMDYLNEGPPQRYDLIITNPPFNKAVDFVQHSLLHANIGVAMLCRLSFLEGRTRYTRIFEKTPPSHVLPFVERVPMVKGRCSAEATTATAYAWFFWDLRLGLGHGTKLIHIPPCRKALERPSDYADPTTWEVSDETLPD
jgi:hypothetical protein